jgi:2-isopropylmalate synthase
VGDLVYTAFSGSHQDAIKKGFEALNAKAAANGGEYPEWAVPYLPLDPKHLGRSYEAVVRVNSQSGKGGVAYIMKAEHGFDLPRRLQVEFSKTIQSITEDTGTEISPTSLWATFQEEYLPDEPRMRLTSHELRSDSEGATTITAQLVVNGAPVTVTGSGNGPIDAFVHALRSGLDSTIDVTDYAEHAMGSGSQATAVAYVETRDEKGTVMWGVGTDPSTVTASLRAVLNAHDRQTRG